MGEKKSLYWRLCKLINPDWMFALLLVAGGAVIVTANQPDRLQVDPVYAVWPKAAILAIAAIISVVILALSTRFDRKHFDDYSYQTMAFGAIVGLNSSLMVGVLFHVFRASLPMMSMIDFMGLTMACWALGYFWFRWRGLNL